MANFYTFVQLTTRHYLLAKVVQHPRTAKSWGMEKEIPDIDVLNLQKINFQVLKRRTNAEVVYRLIIGSTIFALNLATEYF